MTAQDIRVHIIIVTHNSRAYISTCLRAIPKALEHPDLRIRGHVTVVDAASADGTPDLVAAAFPQVHLIRQDDNVGWSRGINLAARAGAGHLLLLNPDTRPCSGSLARLVNTLACTPRAGAVGPALISPDGRIAPEGARAFPSLWHEFADKMGLTTRWPGRPIVGRYYVGGDTRPRPVAVLSGAALLVRDRAWAEVGGLDEQFWLYAGDTDLCRRLWNAGWACMYEPTARVFHVGGASVSADRRVELGIEALDAMYRYFRKHHGRLHAIMYRLMMAGVALVKIPYWGARRSREHLYVQQRILAWCVGKPPDRRESTEQ